MKKRNRISTIFIFTFAIISAFAFSTHAQTRRGTIPFRINPSLRPVAAPVCQPTPTVYLRGFPYQDFSRNSRLSATVVAKGGYFQIITNCMPFDGQVRVTLQDSSPAGGFGVTALQLTNVRVQGNVVTVQAPPYPIYANRTYHVSLFVFGQKWKTANPGQIRIN